jgi:hypothetical protein
VISGLDIDAGHIYYAQSDGTITIKNRLSSTAVDILVSGLVNPHALAHDDSYIFAAVQNGIIRVSKSGGVPTQIFSVPAQFLGESITKLIVHGQTIVFATDMSNIGGTSGALWKMTKDGGSLSSLYSNSFHAAPFPGLVGDDSSIYYLDYQNQLYLDVFPDSSTGPSIGSAVCSDATGLTAFGTKLCLFCPTAAGIYQIDKSVIANKTAPTFLVSVTGFGPLAADTSYLYLLAGSPASPVQLTR